MSYLNISMRNKLENSIIKILSVSIGILIVLLSHLLVNPHNINNMGVSAECDEGSYHCDPDPGDDSCCGADPSCGGNTCSCFLPGTKITMSDGTKKNIEEVKIGDAVLSFDKNNNLVSRQVLELESPIREGYYHVFLDDGTELKVTDEHPLYFKHSDTKEEGWASFNPEKTYLDSGIRVRKLTIGSFLKKEDGKWAKITKAEYIYGSVKTYNLKDVEGDSFFAEGIWSHNKSCFLPGTKVTMFDGTKKNIEEIKAGDKILSFDPLTQENKENKVSEPYSVKRDHYYDILTQSGEKIKATGEHPFYVGFDEKGNLYRGFDNRKYDDLLEPGFKRVEDFKIGDIVFIKKNNLLIKDKIISIKKINIIQQVYNLKLINPPYTYFADNFAVHNKGGWSKTISGKVYCQDSGGPQIPMSGVQIGYIRGANTNPTPSYTTTDSLGNWQGTVSGKEGQFQIAHMWIQSVPSIYSHMTMPEQEFAINCDNHSICKPFPDYVGWGWQDDVHTCYAPNTPATEKTYNCSLEGSNSFTGYDWQFTTCSPAIPTPTPTRTPTPTPSNTPTPTPTKTPTPTPSNTPTPTPTPVCDCEGLLEVINGTIGMGSTFTLRQHASTTPNAYVKSMVYHVERRINSGSWQEIANSGEITAVATTDNPNIYYTDWTYTLPVESTSGTYEYHIWVQIWCDHKPTALNTNTNSAILGASTQKGSLFDIIKSFLSSLFGSFRGQPYNIAETPFMGPAGPTSIVPTILRPTGVNSPQLGTFYPALNIIKQCKHLYFTVYVM